MKRIAPLLLLLLMACSASPRYVGSPGSDSGSKDTPRIRVLLDQTNGQATVIVSSAFRVTASGVPLLVSEQAGEVTVSRNGSTVSARIDPGGQTTAVEGDILIVPQNDGQVTVGGVPYAGSISVRAHGAKDILLINILDLETYLEGVVPHEIGDPGAEAFAAIEAQAVTARTYALTRIRSRNGEAFDVFSGVRDQVYRGREKSIRLATTAIHDTRGMVLEYNKHLSQTYYSATCGGHTSDISLMWPHREVADYLRGGRDADTRHGTFCSTTKKFRWRYSFSGKELGAILRETLQESYNVSAAEVGYLQDIKIIERTRSGRVRQLAITTSENRFVVEGDRIRWILMTDVDNGRILPSTLFDIEIDRMGDVITSVSIVGGGNGHGVGMCQNGAIGMARVGYSYRMILSHYYPGTEIAREY
jgi:stage II sporulation protein D